MSTHNMMSVDMYKVLKVCQNYGKTNSFDVLLVTSPPPTLSLTNLVLLRTDPIAPSPTEVSAHILIGRCLQKRTETRFESVAEVKITLSPSSPLVSTTINFKKLKWSIVRRIGGWIVVPSISGENQQDYYDCLRCALHEAYSRAPYSHPPRPMSSVSPQNFWDNVEDLCSHEDTMYPMLLVHRFLLQLIPPNAWSIEHAIDRWPR